MAGGDPACANGSTPRRASTRPIISVNCVCMKCVIVNQMSAVCLRITRSPLYVPMYDLHRASTLFYPRTDLTLSYFLYFILFLFSSFPNFFLRSPPIICFKNSNLILDSSIFLLTSSPTPLSSISYFIFLFIGG